jgi:hypothetical protein
MGTGGTQGSFPFFDQRFALSSRKKAVVPIEEAERWPHWSKGKGGNMANSRGLCVLSTAPVPVRYIQRSYKASGGGEVRRTLYAQAPSNTFRLVARGSGRSERRNTLFA